MLPLRTLRTSKLSVPEAAEKLQGVTAHKEEFILVGFIRYINTGKQTQQGFEARKCPP